MDDEKQAEKDGHCVEVGCYMFAPDTEERSECQQRCRLLHPPKRVALLGSGRVTHVALMLAVLDKGGQ